MRTEIFTIKVSSIQRPEPEMRIPVLSSSCLDKQAKHHILEMKSIILKYVHVITRVINAGMPAYIVLGFE